MGKTKRLQSPFSKKSVAKTIQAKPVGRRKSLFSLVSPNDVTEESIQIWRKLPSTIRHDPSLASFRLEHHRLHGKVFTVK